MYDGKFALVSLAWLKVEDKDKCDKFWHITYPNIRLDNKEMLKLIKEELINFPHIKSFVFQIEEDLINRKHVHMAIELDDTKSKPVRKFKKTFKDSVILIVEDIGMAREYCSKKYSRVKGTKPVFFGLEDEEEKRLIFLGEKERNIGLMQEGILQCVSILRARLGYDEGSIDEHKSVQLLKRIREEDFNLADERTKLIEYEASKRCICNCTSVIEILKDTLDLMKIEENDKIRIRATELEESLKLSSDAEEKYNIKLLKAIKEKKINKLSEDEEYPPCGTDNVYLLRSGYTDFYKIGYSDNARRRSKELQTGNPEKITLVTFCPGDFALEKKFHKKFSSMRGIGEWFKFDDLEILEVIKEFNKLKIK